MDFRSLNKFNIILNTISGNFLPIADEKSFRRSIGIIGGIYMFFTWSIGIIFVVIMTIGLTHYVEPLLAVKHGVSDALVRGEIVIISIHLNAHRGYIRNVINKLNVILTVDKSDDEELLKRCMNVSVEPHKKRLRVYAIGLNVSIIIYFAMPLTRIFDDNDEYSHVDLKIPAYLPFSAPFNVFVFIGGNIFEIMVNSIFIMKKTGMDVYVNYIITLLTCEYRFLHQRISDAFRETDEELVIAALHKCIQQHYMLIEYACVVL